MLYRYVNERIDNQGQTENVCDYKTVLKTEIAEIMFKNYPSINELLKENSLMTLQNLASELDSNASLMALTTGTKLKKVRCILALNETPEDIEKFDSTIKVNFNY